MKSPVRWRMAGDGFRLLYINWLGGPVSDLFGSIKKNGRNSYHVYSSTKPDGMTAVRSLEMAKRVLLQDAMVYATSLRINIGITHAAVVRAFSASNDSK